MPLSEFGDFLADSFRALRYEHPPAYVATCAALAGRTVRIEIGPPSTLARFSAVSVAISAGEDEADLTLTTDKSIILDLIGGELTLLDAVRADTLQVRGPVGAVAAFHDALTNYLDGAVRSPSFPELLAHYRR